MKKINEILSHLKNNPEFSKINTSFLIKKFIEVLPLKLKKGVKFAYVKNQTLYFVLTHPVYKMEFEYNKADIKSLLKNFKIANVEDIGFFITNIIEKKKSQKKPLLCILSVLMEFLKTEQKMNKYSENLKKLEKL
jgi:hypothetical protein